MNDMDILELARYNQQTAWKILEHTGIMDDSGINAFCDLFGQTFSRDQFKYQFRRRTRLRENIVFIRKTLVTDMMIDTRCFFCMLKIFCRRARGLDGSQRNGTERPQL